MTERDPYIGRRKPGCVNRANVIVVTVLVVLAIAIVWALNSCKGRESIDIQADAPDVFDRMRECATREAGGDSAVARETLGHLVNGGIHIATPDSMRVIGNLGDQQVEGLTHTEIDTTVHDTVVTIYLRAPLADVLEHELANAFVQRHRLALLHSDTAKAQTSAFYKACVRYCPRCTGAY